MSKVSELIKEANTKQSSKKTKNHDLYLRTIIELCDDDEYVAEFVKGVNDAGDLIKENKKLASNFRKIIVKALRKCTSMTTEEAEAAAKGMRLTKEDAQTLHDIVTEAVSINILDLNKKVQGPARADLYVTYSASDVKEAIRNNPKDDSLQTVISARKKMKADTKIFAFQKKVIKKK